MTVHRHIQGTLRPRVASPHKSASVQSVDDGEIRRMHRHLTLEWMMTSQGDIRVLPLTIVMFGILVFEWNNIHFIQVPQGGFDYINRLV